MLRNKNKGFTIVELLIVIVVIGILAAIVVVAYRGIQDRAYDTSVQNDLANIAKKIKMYNVENGVYPAGNTQLATLDIKVNKSAFGSHFDNGTSTYNLLYCRIPASAPTGFALVAYSRTGKGFQYSSGGQLGEYTGPKTGTGPMCTSAGIATSGAVSDRDWFYYLGNWQTSYVGG